MRRVKGGALTICLVIHWRLEENKALSFSECAFSMAVGYIECLFSLKDFGNFHFQVQPETF